MSENRHSKIEYKAVFFMTILSECINKNKFLWVKNSGTHGHIIIDMQPYLLCCSFHTSCM